MNLHFEQGYYCNLLTRESKWHDHSIFELYVFSHQLFGSCYVQKAYDVRKSGSRLKCMDQRRKWFDYTIKTWNFWEKPTFCHRKSEIFGEFSNRLSRFNLWAKRKRSLPSTYTCWLTNSKIQIANFETFISEPIVNR